ncbi:MAG: ubiquinol-cytochrome c reductase cytochrome c subunit [Actinomycetota bacterium]|nr:ubiquinol-cytochrome c reductase cytochrome c subunit [Actinomycetota bacterium]
MTPRTRRAACVIAASVSLAAALAPPLESAAESYLWVHMVQHLVLILVAPLLFVCARPVGPFIRALPDGARSLVNAARHAPFVRRSIAFVTVPAFAWVVHVALVWGWHAPALFDAALRTEPLHVLEHVTFFGSALLFWAVALGTWERRMPAGGAIFYVAFAGIQSTALGALFTFASAPLFPHYEHLRTTGLTALEDQQLAGLIMWIPAGILYVSVAAFLFARWFRGAGPGRDDVKRKAVLPPLLLLVTVALALAPLVPRPAAAQVHTPAPTDDRAPQVYLSDCSFCHGSTGEGTEYGPDLRGVGGASADFMLTTGRMPIDEPDEYPKRSEPDYSEIEVRDIVNYVASLGQGPAIPSVDVAAGNLLEGQQLYIDNCAACHATTGIGGALTNEAVAPALYDATPTQVAEAMRVGGNGREGSMPVFGPRTISEHDLNSIVRYVTYLQKPNDRGGSGLGHLGPIAEGFVGWVLGLGILVLVILWIGERGESAP